MGRTDGRDMERCLCVCFWGVFLVIYGVLLLVVRFNSSYEGVWTWSQVFQVLENVFFIVGQGFVGFVYIWVVQFIRCFLVLLVSRLARGGELVLCFRRFLQVWEVFWFWFFLVEVLLCISFFGYIFVFLLIGLVGLFFCLFSIASVVILGEGLIIGYFLFIVVGS